ncbi:hypothetical protein ACF0H5_023278 [Mactra antiquata]
MEISTDSVRLNNMVKWILLSLMLTVCYCQICDQDAETLSPKTIQEHLYQTAVPRGRIEAGYFEHDIEADEISKCLISCCDKPLCNIAWFTQQKCYTIECFESNKTACDPVPQSLPKYKDTVFIQVRSLHKTMTTNECSIFENNCNQHEECQHNSNNVRRCECKQGYRRKDDRSKLCVPVNGKEDNSVAESSNIIDNDYLPCQYGITDCGLHKECATLHKSSTSGLCVCEDDYVQDMYGDCILDADHDNNNNNNGAADDDADNDGDIGDDYDIYSDKDIHQFSEVCEFGINTCGTNKECVTKTDKSRSGVCQCISGYIEDKAGLCIVINDTVSDLITKSNVIPTASKPDDMKTNTTGVKMITTPKVTMLTVSAGENKEIQLPLDEITLTVFVLPKPEKGEEYQYDWIIEGHPDAEEYGNMEGHNTKILKLTQLIAGLYTFRVQVTGTNKFGEAYVNVTVLPAARENKPPVAVITPTQLEIKLPNSAILDGSDSTDDDKITNYHWDIVSGPLQDNSITGDTETFKIKDLVPGNYTFKLTVTDSDGSTNSTTANVTVIKETDYPPKANAGSDIIIHLPQTSVILYGNQSTDDKGIISYEWIKKVAEDGSGSDLAVDVQGARTSELHLSNLEVGDYTFTLKVTDISQQVSTADVHVYVRPEQNNPPVAQTLGMLEMSLPLDNILLDGTNSSDDQKITSYLWQQTGGPTVLTIEKADESLASASGNINVGKYTFKLIVKDKEDLASSNLLIVNVKQVQNEAPVSNAGGDKVIQLPQSLITLDGSKSTDDHKITEYRWTRDPKSLVAGNILNNSDHQAILQLVNLVAGKYIFTLKVTDSEGLSSTDKASILVKPAVHEKDLLELTLNADITEFTEENLEHLKSQLSLLLPRDPDEGETVIDIQSVTEDKNTGKNGVETLQILKKKLLSSPYITEYKVVKIDTQVCQNNCSNHGHCDIRTKLCRCEAFWTQNIFLYYIHGDSNCDWSILYVVIVCFLIVISCTGAIWAVVCCVQRKKCPCRKCRWRNKRRHRYSLLQDNDNDDIEITELKNSKIQNSSVMISESDFSSDEETLFLNQKKSNGHVQQLNGVNKHLKNTLKT